MDVAATTYYIAVVRLLLLLSALLSALTGVGAGHARAMAAPAVAARSIAAAATPSAAVVRGLRPAGALPTVATIAQTVDGAALEIIPAVPLWASRRRE